MEEGLSVSRRSVPLLRVGGGERGPELRTASMESRHDGSDGNRQCFGGLPVGEVFHITKKNDVLECHGQPPQGVKILNYACLCLLYDHGVTLAESATNTFATSR